MTAQPGIGISDAAKDLYLASNAVSMPANQLVRAGCPVRETDPADRRPRACGPRPPPKRAWTTGAGGAAPSCGARWPLRNLAVHLHEEGAR